MNNFSSFTKFIFFFLSFTLYHQRSSAHFFPDPFSIPPAFNSTPAPWDAFRGFSGCRAGHHVDGLSKLKTYFHYFGYIPTPPAGNFSDNFDGSLESAVRLYQQNFHLNVTGELDDVTLQHIVRPRCGVPDVINGTNTMANDTTPSVRAVAHYTFFQGQPRWPPYKHSLTYAFLAENQLSETVKSVFARAFARWAAVTPLNFTETYSDSDITIGFYSGDHGDGEPFDGVLGTLAHSFSPTNGRFHLDNAETWVVTGDVTKSTVKTAVDLESVAVHEIGHVLGLGHSSDENAIMYPTIPARTRRVELSSDDIVGIQVLYGSNPNYNASQDQFRDVSGVGDGGLWWSSRCFAAVVGFYVLIRR